MYKILLIFVCIGLYSCSSSSLRKFGETKSFMYKTIVIDNTENSYNDLHEVLYVNGNRDSCFNDSSYGNIITVRSYDLNAALNFFYRNKATWNIKETKVKHRRDTVMIANVETQIEVETAFCNFQYLEGFYNESREYASFRMVDPR